MTPQQQYNDLAKAKAASGLRFDPTVNAGHILTFVATMVTVAVAGATGWNLLDKRVVVLEEAKADQAKRDDAQDLAIGEKLTDIKEAVREVRRSVEDLRQDQRHRDGRKP
jgi:hypothetical protein